MTQEKSAASKVNEVADRQIEAIRLMLCPEQDDLTLSSNEDGSMTLDLDCDVTRTVEDPCDFDLDDGDGPDHDWIKEDHWEEIREEANDRFHEYGLSFDYKEGEDGDPGYFCYLISTGGPGTEIRFYTDPGFNMYRAEFWLLEWFDGASKTVTKDPTIQALWDQFQECSAEHAFRSVTFDGY